MGQAVHLDEIFLQLGGWGKYQILHYVALCSVVVFAVFPAMGYIFIARDINYRCKIDKCEVGHNFQQDWINHGIPLVNENVYSRCLHYKPEIPDLTSSHICTNFDKNTTLKCKDFVYERSETTIVHDFRINCEDNLWKLTLIGTINVFGRLLCLPFAGFFSDLFGRKYVMVFSVLVSTCLGLVKSLSVSYYMYLGLEFADSLLGSGMYSGAFILALESVASNKRNMGNTIISCAFTLGHLILGASAWISPSWRILLRVLYAPGVVITAMVCFSPESIKWLLSKKKITRVEEILKTMAKVNTKEKLDEDLLTNLGNIKYADEDEPGDEKDPVEISTRTLVIRIVHCSFTWICCNFPYYGLTIQSVSLFEDPYVNFMLISIIEIPAYLLTYLCVDYFGRRKTLAFSLMLSGLFCISFDLAQNKFVVMTIFLCGKFFITVAYTTLYIYTAEIFPIRTRHKAFGICSMFGCVGAMLAPQVPLLARIHKSLPLLTFAVMALSSGALSFFFPETYSRKKKVEPIADKYVMIVERF